MFGNRSLRFDILIILSIVSEMLALLFLYNQGITGSMFNAFLLFLSSMATGLLLIGKFYNREISLQYANNKKLNSFLLLTCLAISLWMIYSFSNVLKNTPIDIRWSDIIPAIEIVVKRFIDGQNPYLPMTELGYTTPVGYMPFHWLPFTIAEKLHIDYRCISFGIWLITSIFFIIRLKKHNNISAAILCIISALIYFFMLNYNIGMMAMTVELLIASYYMLFVASINSNRFLTLGATTALCLISRYSFAMWLPLFIFILYVSGNRTTLYKAALVALAIIILCYAIPFLSKDWSLPFQTLNNYAGMNWEWQHLCDNGLPCNLFKGIGFAQLFYKYFGADNFKTAFTVCRNVFFITTLGTTIISGIWYWINKRKIDAKIFSLASLKIYFSVFSAFMIVPYDYLMITGLMISVAIYAVQARYTAK